MPLPSIAILVWDDWNREHITKHHVTPAEVEEAVGGEPIASQGYKDRLVLTGPTSTGRMLTVVIGGVPRQADSYYVFSARPASREERARYHEQKGGSA